MDDFKRAVDFHQKGNLTEAKQYYEASLQQYPKHAATLVNLGLIARNNSELQLAKKYYEQALLIDPNEIDGWNNLGVLHQLRGESKSAINAFKKVTYLNPNHIQGLNNLGIEYNKIGTFDLAQHCFEKVLELNENFIPALNNYSNLAIKQNNHLLAIKLLRRIVLLDSCNSEALAKLIHYLNYTCDWTEITELSARLDILLTNEIKANNKAGETPFMNIMRTSDPKMNLAVAKSWSSQIENTVANIQDSIVRPKKSGQLKRIGYLTSDCYNHATMHLMRSFFLQQQQSFEVYLYSYSNKKVDQYTTDAINSVTKFIDISDMGYLEIARTIYLDKIDILVDLKGFTENAQLEVLALKPAPIQVSYLGFPGTLGGSFIDYIIVDEVIAQDSTDFTEKLAYIPGGYQVRDDTESIYTTTREKEGLGPGFIFCSFNQTVKIDPLIYSVWLKLLKNIPDSILWLYSSNKIATDNLLAIAKNNGINHKRIYFAGFKDKPHHLGRYQLAHLCLDTIRCNGHTTTSDALVAGTPVITLSGSHFASRVGESIVRAFGLPELVCNDLTSYYSLAYKLATQPQELQKISSKLAKFKFNTQEFVTKFNKVLLDIWAKS